MASYARLAAAGASRDSAPGANALRLAMLSGSQLFPPVTPHRLAPAPLRRLSWTRPCGRVVGGDVCPTAGTGKPRIVRDCSLCVIVERYQRRCCCALTRKTCSAGFFTSIGACGGAASGRAQTAAIVAQLSFSRGAGRPLLFPNCAAARVPEEWAESPPSWRLRTPLAQATQRRTCWACSRCADT